MSSKRERKTLPTLSTYLMHHSPIKKGVVIKNEDRPITKYNKITSRVFLGNYQAAKDKDFFTQNNIHAVLNCTKDLPNHFAHVRDIEYLRIPVDDSLKEKDFELMYTYMPLIVEFIDKHVNKLKQNILIHCYAGRQRSAISVCAYLVAKHNMTPHEACKYVLDKRKEAFHHGLSLNFDQALLKYHKDLEKQRKK
jgi:protein-tyrosine phosphatase